MNFGEIVEPTTRALIEDDYENYPDNTEYTADWDEKKYIPEDLEVLIFIETVKLIDIFKKCVRDDLVPICKLRNGGLQIYRLKTHSKTKSVICVACFDGKSTLCCGQVILELTEWIRKSQEIITITSASLAGYQTSKVESDRKTLIKMLSNKKERKFPYDKLEPPNLITGLGAGVMSYSIHVGKDCSSFVAYMDASPVDSVNTNPLLKLFGQLNISLKEYKICDQLPSSNLYM